MNAQTLTLILQKLSWNEISELLQNLKDFNRTEKTCHGIVDEICYSYKMELHVQLFPTEDMIEITGPGIHEYINF